MARPAEKSPAGASSGKARGGPCRARVHPPTTARNTAVAHGASRCRARRIPDGARHVRVHVATSLAASAGIDSSGWRDARPRPAVLCGGRRRRLGRLDPEDVDQRDGDQAIVHGLGIADAPARSTPCCRRPSPARGAGLRTSGRRSAPGGAGGTGVGAGARAGLSIAWEGVSVRGRRCPSLLYHPSPHEGRVRDLLNIAEDLPVGGHRLPAWAWHSEGIAQPTIQDASAGTIGSICMMCRRETVTIRS